MNWLQKLVGPRSRSASTNKGKVPEGLWEKCDGCGAVLYKPELEASLMVCPKCGHHHAIRARARRGMRMRPMRESRWLHMLDHMPRSAIGTTGTR